MSREYKKRKRAESEEATRQRIAAAAAELHEHVGPARTTFSAVAERAGVQRATLYRHFPDEDALFEACSSHWSARNPPPDPTNGLPTRRTARRAAPRRGRLTGPDLRFNQAPKSGPGNLRDPLAHPRTRS